MIIINGNTFINKVWIYHILKIDIKCITINYIFNDQIVHVKKSTTSPSHDKII